VKIARDNTSGVENHDRPRMRLRYKTVLEVLLRRPRTMKGQETIEICHTSGA
jgi:hypothetical protein